MVQTNLKGEPIEEKEPRWMVDGEDCRYWFERKGSDEYRRKKVKYYKYYDQQRSKDPEIRKRHREYMQEHLKDPEFRNKYRESAQKWCEDPENKKNARKHKKEKRKKHTDRIWRFVKPKCVMCGELEKRFLNFHHIYHPKIFAVGSTKGSSVSDDDLLAEILKCVVLCSNCHKMLHLALGSRYINPFWEVIEVLNQQPHHPELRWLVFLLYPVVYPQTPAEWHEVWGDSE